MKLRTMISAGALLALVSATMIAADVDLEGVKCVLNPRGAAKEETAVEYRGGEVFFCCNNCRGKFVEAPEDFSTSANFQLVATEQAVQVNCPISGRAVNPEMTVTLNEVEVEFCCGNCKGKVNDADAEEQMELVFSNAAFEKGFEVPDDDDDDDDNR